MTHLAPDDQVPSTGTSADGSISVATDATLRVTGVQVHTMEPLRDASRLDEAFAAAYVAALAGGRPGDGTTPAIDRLRPQRLVLTVRRPTPDLVNRHEVRIRDHLQPRRPHPREHVGRSDNGCVTVTLPVAGGRGRLDVDPGWLQQTSGTRLGAAITEAYVAAYTRRDS